mmetsp:Transcript_27885/g.38548  ORF Transcript_27885/g.38548 Transcript_27885/m.38548 type:complete len:131 (-) Transcript_27885:213-605(-)
MVVALVYSLYYMTMEPVAGLTWALSHGLLCAAAAHAARATVEGAWMYGIALHVLCWYLQIHPGHAVLEKRKPALLDSLAQAFAFAPLFVHMEVMFWCGYRPQLVAHIQQGVDANIAKMNLETGKRVCKKD